MQFTDDDRQLQSLVRARTFSFLEQTFSRWVNVGGGDLNDLAPLAGILKHDFELLRCSAVHRKFEAEDGAAMYVLTIAYLPMGDDRPLAITDFAYRTDLDLH